VSVPFQFNWINGVGPDEDLRFVLNVQPVVPIPLNEKWNLIGRWIMPYVAQPAYLGHASGLADITASAFFSARNPGKLIWGVGPVLGLPMTTDPALGTGKWLAGPTFIVLQQNGPWTVGMLWNQTWSFAGTSRVERAEVSQGFFQPFVSHVSGGLTVTLQSEAVANWLAVDDADTWTIPINLSFARVTHFGPWPMNVSAGAGGFAAKPDGGPEWQLRTVFTIVMPRH